MVIKTYELGLVGESNYQRAVREMSFGDRVTLEHEPDNRYDPHAVVARSADGNVIGYVERGSWAQRAIAVEGKDAEAYVLDVTGGSAGKRSRGIVLRVAIGDNATLLREEQAHLANRKGCLGLLFR